VVHEWFLLDSDLYIYIYIYIELLSDTVFSSICSYVIYSYSIRKKVAEYIVYYSFHFGVVFICFIRHQSLRKCNSFVDQNTVK